MASETRVLGPGVSEGEPDGPALAVFRDGEAVRSFDHSQATDQLLRPFSPFSLELVVSDKNATLDTCGMQRSSHRLNRCPANIW